MTEASFDRLTVVETVYHRPYQDEGFAVDTRFTRAIVTGEQPYQRNFHNSNVLAAEEWKQLDFGWLKENVGMLVITNDEGKFYDVNPTEEEKENTEKRILEIAYTSDEGVQQFRWYIPPKESFRGSPSDPSRLWIRCRHEKAKYTLTVFPM